MLTRRTLTLAGVSAAALSGVSIQTEVAPTFFGAVDLDLFEERRQRFMNLIKTRPFLVQLARSYRGGYY